MKNKERRFRVRNRTFVYAVILLCWGCILKVPPGVAAEACDSSNVIFHSVMNAENPSLAVKGGFSVMVNMCAIEVAVKDLLTRVPGVDAVTLSRYTRDSNFKISDSSQGGRDCSYAGGFILEAGGKRFHYQVESVLGFFIPHLQEVDTAQGTYVIQWATGREGKTPFKKTKTDNSIDRITFTDSKGGSRSWNNILESGKLAKDEVWIFGNIRGKLDSSVPPLNPTSESGRYFWDVSKSLFLAKRSYKPAGTSLNEPHAVSGPNASESPQKGRNSPAVFLPALPFSLKERSVTAISTAGTKQTSHPSR